MKRRPLVSIISVNYNQSALTCDMIRSLKQVTYPNLEIIIVDNDSRDDSPLPITEEFPDVSLIRSERNLGFAGGNNLGISSSNGEYLFFLNNDTEVDPHVLEPMVDLFESDSRIGIASPKIIYYQSGETIQFAGSKGINTWTGRSVTIGAMEHDEGQYDRIYETALIDGAAMMVPARLIPKVGMMPEEYFLYYEELDWCERIKRAGYKSYYVGNAKIYHKESISVGKNSITKTYYMNRNRLLFIRRNSTGLRLLSGSLVFLLFAMPKRILTFAIKREWTHVKALFSGVWWNFRNSVKTESLTQT